MGHDLRIGRRAFLRVTGLSVGLLAVSQLRLTPLARAAASDAGAALRVLTPRDARIMTAIAERITFTGDPSMPLFSQTGGLRTIDTALRELPPDVPQKLSWALILVQYGPPIFDGRLSTFTGLDDDAQDVSLAGWRDSRFQVRQLAFRAFKNLAMLGYYSQDATWQRIHYDGPWVRRPSPTAE